MSRTKIGGIAVLAGSLLLLATGPALAQSNSGMPVPRPSGMITHGQVTEDQVGQMRMFHQQMPAEMVEQMDAWHAQLPSDLNAQMHSMHANMSTMHGEQAVGHCFGTPAVETTADNAAAP